ncbi:MAG: response regulator transcription factor [Gammaproteobacteria bacterium]|nr:response regulator transcription factor [Gammaproteobacteria bacterium]
MKILLIEDHELFREGLKLVLRDLSYNLQIFEACNYDDASKLISDHSDLDLILLDLGLSGIQGIDALLMLREQSPGTPVVILSAIEDSKKVQQAMENGAQGYITKASDASTILNALKFVMSGGVYVPANIFHMKNFKSGSSVPGNKVAFHKLTPRQVDVLLILSEGRQNKEIANILGLKVSTVRAHVASILKAFDVKNRTQAVQYAMQEGLIELLKSSSSEYKL